jgi:hypothetical protein
MLLMLSGFLGMGPGPLRFGECCQRLANRAQQPQMVLLRRPQALLNQGASLHLSLSLAQLGDKQS